MLRFHLSVGGIPLCKQGACSRAEHNGLQVMGKAKVLVKVHPEGKYVVDLDKDIDIAQVSFPSPCLLLKILDEDSLACRHLKRMDSKFACPCRTPHVVPRLVHARAKSSLLG